MLASDSRINSAGSPRPRGARGCNPRSPDRPDELNWHTRNGDVEPRRIAYDRAQEAFGGLGPPPDESVGIGACMAESYITAAHPKRTAKLPR